MDYYFWWRASPGDQSNAADLFHILQACRKETGDKTTPNPSGCRDGNCRFSGIIYQLWYLNSLGQLSSAITNIENGANQLLPMLPGFAANMPWCLTSSPNSAAPPLPPPPPAVDATMPLQVTRSILRAAPPRSVGAFAHLLCTDLARACTWHGTGQPEQ